MRGRGRTRGSWPPAHLSDWSTRQRIDVVARDGKSVLLIKSDSATVVGIDLEIEAAWRQSLGLGHQCRRDPRPPCFGRNDDLVEIAGLRIDGDEAHQFAVSLSYGDGRRG